MDAAGRTVSPTLSRRSERRRRGSAFECLASKCGCAHLSNRSCRRSGDTARNLLVRMPIESASAGRFARNVMHFARALRAAGLPVGPGRVLEALRAVEAVGFESRQDLYWTLHAVFVNRRDQRELFDQCFHIFWRDPQLLERMMHLLLPTLEGEQPPEGAGGGQPPRRRGAEPAASPAGRRRAGGGAAGARARRGADLVQPRAAAGQGFRADVGRGAGPGAARDRPAAAADHAGADPAVPPARAWAADRPAPHPAPVPARRRGGDRPRPQGAAPAAPAAGDPVRHLGLDEPLLAHAAAVHARDHQRPRPGAQLPVRHPAHQRHPPAAQPRHRPGAGQGRRAGPGLGRRHADRRLPQGVQPGLVAPRAGPGCRRAPDQRRARPRRRRGPRGRDGAAAQELPAADLAQPPVALRRLRAHLDGSQGDDPPRRRFPPGAQPGQPARADRGAEPRGHAPGRGAERVGRGVARRE